VQDGLIRSGALDCFDDNRARLMAQLAGVLQIAEQHNKSDTAGQNDLFGLSVVEPPPSEALVDVEPWTEYERLKSEKITLGLYLTGHPFDSVKEEMNSVVSGKLLSLLDMELASPKQAGGQYRRVKGKPVTAAGLILEVRTRPTKSGSKIATVILDDGSARLEAVAYSETFDTFSELLVSEQIVVIEGGLAFDDFAGQNRLSIETVMSVEQARERFIKDLLIELDVSEKNHLTLKLRLKGAVALMRPDNAWCVSAKDSLIEQLHKILPEQEKVVRY